MDEFSKKFDTVCCTQYSIFCPLRGLFANMCWLLLGKLRPFCICNTSQLFREHSYIQMQTLKKSTRRLLLFFLSSVVCKRHVVICCNQWTHIPHLMIPCYSFLPRFILYFITILCQRVLERHGINPSHWICKMFPSHNAMFVYVFLQRYEFLRGIIDVFWWYPKIPRSSYKQVAVTAPPIFSFRGKTGDVLPE